MYAWVMSPKAYQWTLYIVVLGWLDWLKRPANIDVKLNKSNQISVINCMYLYFRTKMFFYTEINK